MNEFSYRKLYDLTGKVAVVTGGAGILGRHFCAGLAESGAAVAVADLQDESAGAGGWPSYNGKRDISGRGFDYGRRAVLRRDGGFI